MRTGSRISALRQGRAIASLVSDPDMFANAFAEDELVKRNGERLIAKRRRIE